MADCKQIWLCEPRLSAKFGASRRIWCSLTGSGTIHPDHRAVAQAVQDACYLVTVPHIAADVPVLARDPVVAYMVDTFTRPQRFLPHVLMNVDAELDTIVRMAACHQSQVFQWLPYHDGLLDSVPDEEHARLEWLKGWFLTINAKRTRTLFTRTAGARTCSSPSHRGLRDQRIRSAARTSGNRTTLPQRIPPADPPSRRALAPVNPIARRATSRSVLLNNVFKHNQTLR